MNKTVSFCIPCMGRLEDLKKTLRQNISDNNGYTGTEFIVVNFGTIGMLHWITTRFPEEVESGLLKYFEVDNMDHWHAAAAKNCCADRANGDIIVSLDADNYIGRDGGRWLVDMFNNYDQPIVLHQFSGVYRDGTFGRIAALRAAFHAVGGYEELLIHTVYEDNDLIERLKLTGNKYVRLNYNNRAIVTPDPDRVARIGAALSTSQLYAINKGKSIENIASGKLIATQVFIPNFVKYAGQ